MEFEEKKKEKYKGAEKYRRKQKQH